MVPIMGPFFIEGIGMNYIEKIRLLVNQCDDKYFFIINKLSALNKSKKLFSLTPNRNFLWDMKSVIPTEPYVRSGGEFDNFEGLYNYVSTFKTFRANDFLRNPDSNRHKICINLPESEDHIKHLYSLHSENAYKFLNAQFISRNPMSGGYHARTTANVIFPNPYTLRSSINLLRNGDHNKSHLDKIKTEFNHRLERINYILDYIGGYKSENHIVKNRTKIETYIADMKNVVDNYSIDDIVNDAGFKLYISTQSYISININFKNEADLLQFVFIKDEPNIQFLQTVIFRPLKKE